MRTAPAQPGAATSQQWQRLLALMLLGNAAAAAEERHPSLQGLRSTTAAPLALPPLLGLEEDGEEEVEATTMENNPDQCDLLHDPHGEWKGDRHPGKDYSLFCRPGYAVTNNRGTKAKISCRDIDGVLAWPEKPSCYNINDCDGLKWGCGAFGMCMDDVNNYTCNCEKGRIRKKYGNETICEDVTSCGGRSCGAYGVCVKLSQKEDDWKCECSDGFWFNDEKQMCDRRHCTLLPNESGTWSGSTLYGQQYTLTCDEESFVRGQKGLKTVTTSCDWNGVIADWPKPEPTCENIYREAEEALWESRKRSLFTVGVLCCIACAALAAGLTLGVAGMQPFTLKVILATRPEHYTDRQDQRKLREEQQSAEKVLPLVQDHHRLLITLMMFNTLANEALPIFLDELVPSWAAVLISVSAVLIFCEVIPSAIFTGPSQLRIAGFFAPFVTFLEWILYYPSIPILKLLHSVMPHEDDEGDAKYSRAELRAIIRKQGNEDNDFDATLKPVKEDNIPSRPSGGVPSGSNLSLLGGADPATWLLGAGHESNRSPAEHPVVEGAGETHATPHEAATPILSNGELQQINGALNLHQKTLSTLVFTKRRQCLLAGGNETAQDVLSRLHSGLRVVLVLRDGVQQRQGHVTAEMVHGILWPADLLTGHTALGDIHCGMPVPLPEDISILDALHELEKHSSSSGLVLYSGEDGGGTVKGAVRAQELLAAVLCTRRREDTGLSASNADEEQEQFAQVATARRTHAGRRGFVRQNHGSSSSEQPRGQYRALTLPSHVT